jgi:hypothetical protein
LEVAGDFSTPCQEYARGKIFEVIETSNSGFRLNRMILPE